MEYLDLIKKGLYKIDFKKIEKSDTTISEMYKNMVDIIFQSLQEYSLNNRGSREFYEANFAILNLIEEDILVSIRKEKVEKILKEIDG
jgi:hypothetical protein